MFNKREYDFKYTKEHYKRISLNIRKEEFEKVQAHITSRNENLTAFIKRAISQQIKRDSKK